MRWKVGARMGGGGRGSMWEAVEIDEEMKVRMGKVE